MKKIFALLLITLIAALSLVACGRGNQDGGKEEDPCKSGHTFTTYTSNNDATCSEDGTKSAKCENCDAIDTKIDKDSKKGHTFGEWKIVKEPDCTQAGEKTRSCTVCRASEKTEIASLGHSFNTDTFGYQSADGHAHRCTVCGEHDTLAAHTPGAAATETEAQKCTVCQYVIAAPLGHTHAFTLETKGEVTLKSAADCINAATYYKSCSCGAVSENDTFTDGDPLGHDFRDATCDAPKTCKRCSITEGDPRGHRLGEWETYKEATASEKGEMRKECADCDYYESQEIPAKEPNMDPNGWTPVKKP